MCRPFQRHSREADRVMLAIAAILFAVAAVGGLAMAVVHSRGKLPPIPLAILHGLFAAAGLLALLLALGNGPGFSGVGGISFLMFLIAAIAGFYLFSRHLISDHLPTSIILIHGGVALAGFICLLLTIAGAAA